MKVTQKYCGSNDNCYCELANELERLPVGLEADYCLQGITVIFDVYPAIGTGTKYESSINTTIVFIDSVATVVVMTFYSIKEKYVRQVKEAIKKLGFTVVKINKF